MKVKDIFLCFFFFPFKILTELKIQRHLLSWTTSPHMIPKIPDSNAINKNFSSFLSLLVPTIQLIIFITNWINMEQISLQYIWCWSLIMTCRPSWWHCGPLVYTAWTIRCSVWQESQKYTCGACAAEVYGERMVTLETPCYYSC